MALSLPAKSTSLLLLILFGVTPGSLAGQLLASDSLRMHGRQGMWFNVGLGTGVGNGIGGQSATLALGWTLSPRFQLAVGTSDWRSGLGDGNSVTLGTLDLRAKFYPQAYAGFFLTGGLGLGYFWISDSGSGPDVGRAILLGVGFDAPIKENMDLTIFINRATIHTPDPSGSGGQVGVGLTFH